MNAIGTIIYTLLVLVLGIYIGIIMTRSYESKERKD